MSAEPFSVDSVITTHELAHRPPRAPQFESESRVLLKLAATMAEDPRGVLQALVDSARDLCRAGSTGISLLDSNETGVEAQFTWVATAGAFAELVGSKLPRHFSPCGAVLDANRLLMMADPVRHFPYIAALSAPVCEVLLVPFYRQGLAIGTVWIASHTTERRFDQEDARLVTNLATFAAAALQVIATADSNRRLEETARLAAERDVERLALENRRIAAWAIDRAQAEESIRRELEDTQRLREVAARSVRADDPSALFEEILAAAIDITGADAGTIQLLDAPSGTLSFIATRGLNEDFLAGFARVDANSGSSCGVALAGNARAFVVFDDPLAPDPDGSLNRHREVGLCCAQSTPLISRAGRPLGMFSTHWRRQKTLSERELRYLDLLARQAADLIERTQAQLALRQSEQELREADRRKDEFLAVLAHELRNPLTPIRNGIELLKRAAERPDVVEQVRPIMARQIRQIVHLIDDLLDVSRISCGKIELKREIVAVSRLIECAVEANITAMTEAGIEWTVDIDDPDRLLEVDPTRISQVLSNVLHNAAKFTPRGGRVTLNSAFTQARGGAQSELIIRIADTGVGITQDGLRRIFALFTQVHSESVGRHGGLGIGLSLARSLVELHGGSIAADSAGLGLGTEFTILLPAPAIGARELGGGGRPRNDLAGLRVLIVDDNQDAADSMALLLADWSAEVRVAYEGSRALELLDEFSPALVLLDIGMPTVDGYEACREIRRRQGSAISIVAVTGWGQDEDRRRTAEAGFDAHLTKPVNPAEIAGLAATLRTAK